MAVPMHEATIAKYVIDILSSRARSHSDTAKVIEAELRIGSFRNVDGESLQFAFDALKQSCVRCKNCSLRYYYVPVKATCASNQHEYCPSADHHYRCHSCDAGIGSILSGNELEIVSVKLEYSKENSSYA